jgi:hypothetical protein
MSITDNPIYNDPKKAREWFESVIWPEGPICPHCGVVNCAYTLKGKSQRAATLRVQGVRRAIHRDGRNRSCRMISRVRWKGDRPE